MPCMRMTLAFFIKIRMLRKLKKEFMNACKWFVDNKLSIHFGEDKTKCILFSKVKNQLRLKGYVCYIFASLFCMSKRKHFRNKEKCFYLTLKALFILEIIKF